MNFSNSSGLFYSSSADQTTFSTCEVVQVTANTLFLLEGVVMDVINLPTNLSLAVETGGDPIEQSNTVVSQLLLCGDVSVNPGPNHESANKKSLLDKECVDMFAQILSEVKSVIVFRSSPA